jgi:hypothetical protein
MFRSLLYKKQMEKGILISILVVVFFFVFRVVQMKYIDKQWMPLKNVVRDVFMVFAASFIGINLFFYAEPNILEFFSVVTDNSEIAPIATQIFTDEPGF